jgi:endonuclease/exonuclease/phosphatase family metal-dependent hydrolase
MTHNLKIINWNIAGAKYLEVGAEERPTTREKINSAIHYLVKAHHPDILTLQECVEYGEDSAIDYCYEQDKAESIIDCPEGFDYYFFPLIDTCRLSAKDKWDKVREKAGWKDNSYFSQGNGFLIKKDLPLHPVLDLAKVGVVQDGINKKNYIEKINLETGLYMGNRDTERRAALVAHFIFNFNEDPKPLDVFVINTHLTTLTMEREGIPKIDRSATTEFRNIQLEVIFNGIVSRYNEWRRLGYPNRGKERNLKESESTKRYEPLWIIAGDFNFMPISPEYQYIKTMNFIDIVAGKGRGTKAPGHGIPATITLDYIFAGPQFLALNPILIKNDIRGNFAYGEFDQHILGASDHYPMFASIPMKMRTVD